MTARPPGSSRGQTPIHPRTPVRYADSQARPRGPAPAPRRRATRRSAWGVAVLAPLLALALIVVLGLAVAVDAATARSSSLLSRLLDHAQHHHPTALWHIVHDLCVTDKKASGHSAPCARVNLKGGYAVIRDLGRPSQYLLVPTHRIDGIESPQLQSPDSPNYWAAAWSARDLVARRLGHAVDRPDIGLAINSVDGRTQNQLHIHIDCIQAGVLRTLADHQDEIGPRWATFGYPLAGVLYRARWVDGADLDGHDPFKLLAAEDPAAHDDMAHEALAVIGAFRPDGSPGFILLSDHGDASQIHVAVGEALMDHACKAATGAS